MRYFETETLTKDQKEGIRLIWNKEYPLIIGHDRLESFAKYLSGLKNQNHLLLFDDNNSIKAWFCDFIRNDERQFAMVLDSEIQGKGHGSHILSLAKQKYKKLSAWVVEDSNTYKKENGEFYSSPINFYMKNNFKIIPNTNPPDTRLNVIKIYWESLSSD